MDEAASETMNETRGEDFTESVSATYTVHNTHEELAKETELKKVVSLLKEDKDCLSTEIEKIKDKIKIKR